MFLQTRIDFIDDMVNYQLRVSEWDAMPAGKKTGRSRFYLIQKDSTPFVRVLPLAAHCHQNEVLFTITIRYECCITANPVMILWFGSEEEYDNGNDQTRV